jgi:hypothetical protein
MEHWKRLGNEASHHTSRRQKNPRGSTKGRSRKGEILSAATGRDRGPPTRVWRTNTCPSRSPTDSHGCHVPKRLRVTRKKRDTFPNPYPEEREKEGKGKKNEGRKGE